MINERKEIALRRAKAIAASNKNPSKASPVKAPAFAEKRDASKAIDELDPNAKDPKKTQPSPRWDETPLRAKITLTATGSLVIGLLLGMYGQSFHIGVWIAVCALLLAFVHFARMWTYRPLQKLLHEIEQVQRLDRPKVLNSLPIHRQDEVGQIARAIHAYSATALRDYHQAKHLRRTMDDKVERATKHATRKLEARALQDALTGMGNRMFMDEQLPALFESCKQSGTDLTCIAIDLDNFKLVNDTHGHAAGDDLLKFLSQLIKASARSEDCAIRTGGDEFVVLMPDCMTARVKQFAYNLIALFRQHSRARYPGQFSPDLSIGVASVKACRATTPDELLKAADSQLYVAKRAGKGCVVGA